MLTPEEVTDDTGWSMVEGLTSGTYDCAHIGLIVRSGSQWQGHMLRPMTETEVIVSRMERRDFYADFSD